MACWLVARLALASAAILVAMPGMIGGDNVQTDLVRLELPMLPEVPALTLVEHPQPVVQQTAVIAPIDRAPTPHESIPVVSVPADLVQAVGLYGRDGLSKGDEIARTLPDGIPRTTAEWVALRTYPREAGYARIQAFVAAHPQWPSVDWLSKRSEEALFGDKHSVQLVKSAFALTPPRTPAGKIALARILMADNDAVGAALLIRDVWKQDDFNRTIEKVLLNEFSPLLTKADHKYRADRLLYKEDTVGALRVAAIAGVDMLALAKARAAIINETASDALVAAVPAPLAKDPGLMFAQIQKLRRAEKWDEAARMLLAAPRDAEKLINGDEWWVERRLVARALLEHDDAARAWRISAEHSAQSPSAKVEAEFHAGWIALRFLHNAALARGHFSTLSALSDGPSSQARAAYWLGRTQDELGDADGAAAFYQRAAIYPTTFYGQLALSQGTNPSFALRTAPAPVAREARSEATLVAEMLLQLGSTEIAAPLIYDSVRNSASEAEVAALADIVARTRNAALSLQVGKLAARRGIALDELAFPDFGVPDFVPLAGSADKALIYAIVRQESAFQARASSGAGAKGLMQLMVATARTTAKKAGVVFDAARLTSDPSFNTQLGAAHLGTLFEEHGGSYVLTFAAYNAGGSRVKEWIKAHGDPRQGDVDVIDWIERIPITETRQYVQHIMENLQVYRARIGRQSTLLIASDLRAQGGHF